FAECDVKGPNAAQLLEYSCVAKVGGDTAVGKGVDTHFRDAKGGVRADLTVLRLREDHYRVIDGADAGHRDLTWVRRMAQDRGAEVTVTDTTTQYGCLGVWGPNARSTIQKIADEPEAWSHENFPFAALRELKIKGVPVLAFRISYVGEQGWELHFKYEDGLALWDALHALGVTPVGVETYANSRRMEKSLRLQNADLLTEYNLLEADLARPKVKAADFHGKEAFLKFREREHQPAYLCTLSMISNLDSKGVARYPVGNCPVLNPETGATLIDSEGRRSYTTSIAFGPTIGKNIALAYLPHEFCQVGRELQIQYFVDVYPVKVEAVGYRALYDPENIKPRS
ncbi:MAG: aminomethyl transferase family protein, partial [Comamonadaceae bacterium]